MTCRYERLPSDAPWDRIHRREIRRAVAIARRIDPRERSFTPIRLAERLGPAWRSYTKGDFLLRSRSTQANATEITEVWCHEPDDTLTLEATLEARAGVVTIAHPNGEIVTDGLVSAITSVIAAAQIRHADLDLLEIEKLVERMTGVTLLAPRRRQRGFPPPRTNPG